MEMFKIKKALIEGEFCAKLKNKIIYFFKNLFSKNTITKIDKLIARKARRSFAKTVSIQNNKIVFVTTRGTYNCNQRAIANEIIRRELPWELVWVIRKANLDNIGSYPPELDIVKRDSYEFYQACASAKVIIDNSANCEYMDVYKKPGQVFIETWHGSWGLKRFDSSTDKVWIKKTTSFGKKTDICVTNSRLETKLMKDTYWGDSEIWEFGQARNDILLSDEQADERNTIIEKLRKQYMIGEDVHVLLYAPTFRDDMKLHYYKIDYEGLKATLEERFGGEWVIMVRLHFLLKKEVKKLNLPEYVIDVTSYDDIQDLLLIADVGISDYSSWICDFADTKKPIFLFAVDYRLFGSERGFVVPLKDTPFSLAQSNKQLLANIAAFDEVEYIKKCDKFFEKIGLVNDGCAAKRIVDKLEEIVGK